jgi:hypothetical protein
MGEKSKRLKHSSWFPIITPIITFVFGIIGGKLLDIVINPLFDRSTKVVLIGIIFSGLLSVIALIVFTTFAKNAEEREATWLESFGAPAELVFEKVGQSKGYYLRRLIESIHQASEHDEILIMTQHRSTTPLDDLAESHKQIREEYCSLLLQKVRGENIAYRRILCFDNSTGDVGFDANCVMPWLIDHFREMLKVRRENPNNVSIKISRKKIGADIFVIRRKVGVVLLDVYDLKTGATSTSSSLFFHNPPNQQIIEQLHSWFWEIDGQDGTVTLTEANLPNP